VGMRVTKKSEVRPALLKAIETQNTVFIDFRIEPEENVYPMVPAGQAINKMIEGLA
jgi:acetolactate synthase I/II/III large subunit